MADAILDRLLHNGTRLELKGVLSEQDRNNLVINLASVADPKGIDQNVHSLLRILKLLPPFETAQTNHKPTVQDATLLSPSEPQQPIDTQLNKLADNFEKVHLAKTIEAVIKAMPNPNQPQQHEGRSSPRLFASTGEGPETQPTEVKDSRALQKLLKLFQEQNTPLKDCVRELIDYLTDNNDSSPSTTKTAMITALANLLDLDRSANKALLPQQLCEDLRNRYLADSAELRLHIT